MNREREGEIQVNLSTLKLRGAHASRLAGPSFDATTGVSFAGAAVDADGTWKPAAAEPFHGATITVPAMSAVVVREGS